MEMYILFGWGCIPPRELGVQSGMLLDVILGCLGEDGSQVCF